MEGRVEGRVVVESKSTRIEGRWLSESKWGRASEFEILIGIGIEILTQNDHEDYRSNSTGRTRIRIEIEDGK